MTERLDRIEALVERNAQAIERLTNTGDRIEANVEGFAERLTSTVERIEVTVVRAAEQLAHTADRIEVQTAQLSQQLTTVENRIINLDEKLDRLAAIAESQASTCDRLSRLVERLVERN